MTELGRASLFALSGVALVLGVTAGCSDSPSTPVVLGGAGGAGTSSGGNSISGSSNSGGSSGGIPNGGSGMTAGTAGSGGSGGTGGTAGSGGTGGNGGSGGVMTGCTVLPVVQAMIYEFPAPIDPGAGGAGGAGGEGGAGPVVPPVEGFSFGYTGNVASGFSFFYPETTLTSNIAEGFWHVSGTVGTYAGFQVGFVCGADASDYLGISFKISGNAGPSGSLSFVAAHAANVWRNPADTTTLAKCMAPGQYDGTCLEATATVEVTGTEETVSLLWEDFENGRPEMNTDPAQLMALRWLFDWDAVKELDPEANEYAVDVRLDDLTFIEE